MEVDIDARTPIAARRVRWAPRCLCKSPHQHGKEQHVKFFKAEVAPTCRDLPYSSLSSVKGNKSAINLGDARTRLV